ncbi:phosphatidylserine decarboxylase, partial [Burkholderia multivorans]
TATNLRLRDRFWIKGQPYSLRDIFTPARLPLAEHFVVGDRVIGAVDAVRMPAVVVVRGQIRLIEIADVEGEDPSGLNDSQGYMTAVATRAIVA